MLRPCPARWFEILAARDDASLVLEALARTGAVELEPRTPTALPATLSALAPLLGEYAELAVRYRAYWPPAAECRPSAFPEPPQAALTRCLATLRAWAIEAEPLIQALQGLQAEAEALQLWQPVLVTLATRHIDPALLAGHGPWLGVRLFALPAGTDPALAWPGDDQALQLLGSAVPAPQGSLLLVAGRPAALQAMARVVSSIKGRTHTVPGWLMSDAARNQARIDARLAAIATQKAQVQAQLAALQSLHPLQRALGDANRLQWVLHNVHGLQAGALLCWVTGWTVDERGDRLARALRHSGARALLHFAAPPADAQPPLRLRNPPWVQPFEVFSRALGMPASNEADPSVLLAVAVPLLFGYMFGDLGQGLVIAAAGWWLRKRFAVARLLLAGGLAAAAFGVLFGSVFSLHGLLPAGWLHPLAAPLPVLIAPLIGGALLLLLGLLLDALAAWWRHEGQRWLRTDAALIVVYLGLLGAFITTSSLWAAAAGALAFCAGHAAQARQWVAGLSALGELVEKTLQILINTLSFARVGAFALAHAGLSSAIVALMDAADSVAAKALVLVLGNALVILLETLVVSIQTTRLVLFEFFTRFMQGRGRAFRPLPAPPFTVQES